MVNDSTAAGGGGARALLWRATLSGCALSAVIVAGAATVARALDFDCLFDEAVISTVQEGESADLFGSSSESFGFLLLDVDRAARTGIMRGNAGRSDVALVESWHGDLTFIEVTPAGNLTVTTIFGLRAGVNSRERHAVHSRHLGMGMGYAMFSQNAGHCTELPN